MGTPWLPKGRHSGGEAVDEAIQPGSVQLMDAAALGQLFMSLRDTGFSVIGPTVRDGAIVLGELQNAGDLPFGWGVRLEPGGCRLRRRGDNAAFGHSAGPGSWKQFLHPPREKLWSVSLAGGGFEAGADDAALPRLAFFGVRPCDLRAIGIQDQVLGGGHGNSRYGARRAAVLIVAVNCTEPGETCFCASMGTGPEAGPGYDLALTELVDGERHSFLVDVGTQAGAGVMASVPHAEAGDATIRGSREAVAGAARRMGRSMPQSGLRELLAASHDAARWEDVASRCLSCGNCTLACPTCFCTAVEDISDLSGDHAERWQHWASCFEVDFSYIHGGPVRASASSRYRQWLTHKLGTWHDQFGSSGCVGCGRCIVWCPVGIDITEEVAALRAEAPDAAASDPATQDGAR